VSTTAAWPDGAIPPGAAGPTPAEVMEAVVSFLADALAANAALQAVAPGAAFVAPVWPELAGLPASGPAATAFMVGATQILTRAGLPAAAGAFATSSPAVDWQACADGAFAVLSCLLAGAALVTGAGTLSGGTVFSPDQLVADSEIHSWCAAIAAGITVDDETLAVDAIKQVDICGNFLGQKHTRRHMKDVWRPRLLDRTAWDAWVAGGRQGAPEKASELAGSLLSGHEVEPLDSETAATLERIIAAAGL
jgi:trimethylamine--corrinoid protein Co-methyltransferase